MSSLNAEQGPLGAGRARVVQDNLRSVGSSVAPLFRFLATLITGFVGLIILVVALSLLIAIGAVLGVVVGFLPDGGWVHTGDIPTDLLRNTLPVWGLVAGFVVFLIPTLSLLLAAVRLFVKRPLLPASARLTFFGLWLVALLGLLAALARLKADFRERADVTTAQTFVPPAGPVVVLDSEPYDDDNLNLRPDRLLVQALDSGQPLRLTTRVTARGFTTAAARQAATQVEARATLSDSTLAVPSTFRFKPGAAWRNQQVRLTLALPADRRYRLTESFTNQLDENVYDDRYSRDNQNDKRLFRVEKGRFVLASGPETTLAKDDENDEDGDPEGNFDINVNGEHVRIQLPGIFGKGFELTEPGAGAARRTFPADDFTAVNVDGGYQVRIRRGDAFRVVGRGPAEELDRARVDVSGDELRITPRGSIGWRSFTTKRAVLFEITLPTLTQLRVDGAARADVSGFENAGGELRLDQEGASTVKLTGLAGRPLKLDLDGAARTLLAGTAPRLEAKLGGGAQLHARRLSSTEAELETDGAAHATLTVERELRANADGASSVTYYGNPSEVQNDTDGAAHVNRGDADDDSDDTE